jgi:hypothetical protein
MIIASTVMIYISPWIPLIAAIVASVIVWWLGSCTYLRHKEYELIAKRYLDEGIDAIIKNIEQSLSVFRQNWWQSLIIIRNFQNLGQDMRPELYKKPFIQTESSSFEIWRHHRLIEIVGDKVFYEAHQLLEALVSKSYEFFQDDLISTIRVAIEGGKENEIIATRDRIIPEYTHKIKEWNKTAECFYVLTTMLQKIAFHIEKKRFLIKDIEKYSKDSEIKSCVISLKEEVKKMRAMLNQTLELPST